MNKTILATMLGVVLTTTSVVSAPADAQQTPQQQLDQLLQAQPQAPQQMAPQQMGSQPQAVQPQGNPFGQAPAGTPSPNDIQQQLALVQQQQAQQQAQLQAQLQQQAQQVQQPQVLQQPQLNQQPQVQQQYQQIPLSSQVQQQYQAQQPMAGIPVSAPPMNPPSNLPPLPSDFEVGVQQTLPMSPEEIRTLRRMLDDRQKAASELPNPPKSVTGSVSVSMDPGSAPAVVRPFYGVSTSLVLLDSTGAPWPVENFTVGNRGLFMVERLDGAVGSSFVITPQQTYGQSNLILKLVGHPTPVVINLVSGQKIHDARVEARVSGRGPNAQVTSMPLVQGVDSRLMSVLDGVPPQGRKVTISGDRSSLAWMMPNGRLWLRTPLRVVSPAPLSFVSASDGTHVYELAPTATILTMLNNQFVTLQVDGCLQECNSGQSAEYDW